MNRPGESMGRVHLAAPTDARTACGRWALDPDGTTRRLETDTDAEQVSCRACLRSLRK
jgi:hypothetical protein